MAPALSADIVPIADNVALPDRPIEGVVELARELLVLAERGEISGLAFAYVDPALNIHTNWTLKGRTVGYVLASGVARLLHKMHASQD